MFMILMMFFTMTVSLFAYEPNKECFEATYIKCTDSVDILYKEKYDGGERCFTVVNIKDNNKNIECSASSLFFYFKAARDIIEIANDDTYKNKVKNEAINEVPFVTEENFCTISEEEYVKMFTKYIKNIYEKSKSKSK